MLDIHSSSRQIVWVLLAGLCACAGPAPEFAQQTHQVKNGVDVVIASSESGAESALKIQYLGAGGYLFEFNNERLLTAPFYSNPEFLSNIIPGLKIKRRDDVIEANLPAALKAADHNVKAILVGHSHYDHLMDVPYLLNTYLKGVKVYGSTTATAILDNLGFPCSNAKGEIQAISVNENAAAETWIDIAGSHISILPLKSSHAPHFLGLTFQKGFHSCGEEFELNTPADWTMGEVYAYLIDFKDDNNKTIFRVYYQDSASNPVGEDSGLVPDAVLKDRGVDIALLVLAGSHNVKQYPASRVNNTQASLYVVGHWEDFFGIHADGPLIARGSDEAGFISRLERAIHANPRRDATTQWVMPLPGQTITVTR